MPGQNDLSIRARNVPVFSGRGSNSAYDLGRASNGSFKFVIFGHLKHHSYRISAFTLIEVVVAISICALTLGGIIAAYLMSASQAEWSGYSLAANALALQKSEQARASKWDPLASPPIDQLVQSNFPIRVELLDRSIPGMNAVYATNFTTISWITTTPPLKLIQVDCIWSYRVGKLFTNTIVTYRAPDQ